jgi:hypothetical protein
MTFGQRSISRALNIAFALLLAILAVRTLRAPQFEFGDGREYVLQTQAIVFDHTLAIDPSVRGPYWNDTNPYGVKLNCKEHLLVSKALPIFRASYYFCACSDLSLLYEAYDLSSQSED